MFGKLNRLFKEESGITALETAIILIAFVVVASVFAFTILSAGTSSTEKSKDAIYSGLESVEGSMEVVGDVMAYTDCTQVYTVEFTLASAGGTAIDMTVGDDKKVIMAYRDENVFYPNVSWTQEFLVSNGTEDDMLEQDEQVLITVPISATLTDPYSLTTDIDFVIEIKPPSGGVIPVARRTPSDLDTVVNLH